MEIEDYYFDLDDISVVNPVRMGWLADKFEIYFKDGRKEYIFFDWSKDGDRGEASEKAERVRKKLVEALESKKKEISV